jgi:hypothetical protein
MLLCSACTPDGEGADVEGACAVAELAGLFFAALLRGSAARLRDCFFLLELETCELNCLKEACDYHFGQKDAPFQCLHYFLATLPPSNVQCCLASHVLSLHGSALCQQQADNLDMAILSSKHERCPSLVVIGPRSGALR